LDELTFTQFDSVPAGAKIEVQNNGHSYEVKVMEKTFSVSGGGLSGTFSTLQFHFHWGSDDTKGSEHTVNGKKYPAEVCIYELVCRAGGIRRFNFVFD
jgi:carbonic anhydrase